MRAASLKKFKMHRNQFCFLFVRFLQPSRLNAGPCVRSPNSFRSWQLKFCSYSEAESISFIQASVSLPRSSQPPNFPSCLLPGVTQLVGQTVTAPTGLWTVTCWAPEPFMWMSQPCQWGLAFSLLCLSSSSLLKAGLSKRVKYSLGKMVTSLRYHKYV